MCTRKFYCLYDLNENEQCIMIEPLNRIADFLQIQERSIRKAMYLNRKIKKRYIVKKFFDN